MKMTQLLTGAAAIALLAGVASAQTVTVDAGSDVSATGNVIAAEIDIANANLTGDLILNLDFTGPVFAGLGDGDFVDFTVDLTGFEFTQIVTGADVVANGADPNCAFAIQAGGNTGASSVTFRSTGQINACADADVDVTLPIVVTAADATYSTETRLVGPDNLLSSSTGDSDGVAPGSQPFVTQENAFSVAIADGQNPADLDAPAYILFGGNTEDSFGTLQVVDSGAAFADLAGTAMDFDDVVTDDNTLTITLSDATGIDISADGADDGTDPNCTPSGTTCVIDLADGDLTGTVAGGAVDILVVSENDALAPVVDQNLSAALSLDAESNYSVAGITGLTGDLDPIGRDDGVGLAGTFGAFPWTSLRTTGGTLSRFRITGLDTDLAQDDDECIVVNVLASSGALPDGNSACIPNVVISASNEADANADGEWTATFSSADIAEGLGITTETINGDIEFDIRIADTVLAQEGENVLRLYAKGGIVTGTGFDN